MKMLAAALLIAMAGAVAFIYTRVWRRARRTARSDAASWSEAAIAPSLQPGAASEPVQFDLSVGAVGRAAAKIAAPAVLFFPTMNLFSFMLPLTIAAVGALSLAFLILARLASDHMVLRYDSDTVTVRGLMGEATMLWADVSDVAVRTAAWWNLAVMFNSGARRNLVVFGAGSRLGGPDTLYIPIDLLGLDQGAVARLVSRLLAAVHGPRPAAAAAIAPAVNATEAVAASALREHGRFDADAIIARYIAARETPPGAPSLAAPARPVFGRKVG